MQVQDFVAKVRELAATYPDAVYVQVIDDEGESWCHYDKGVVENGPRREGCIIGQCFPEEVFETDTFLEQDRSGVTTLLPALFGFAKYTDEMNWLRSVQSFQDRGDTWETAVRRADDDHS